MIEPECSQECRELGRNVADAASAEKETGKSGVQRRLGICPYCHSNMIRVYEDGHVTCPQCNVEGTVTL